MEGNTNVNNTSVEGTNTSANQQQNKKRNKMNQAVTRQYRKALDDLDDKRTTMDDLLSAHPNMEEYIKTLVRQQIDEMIRRELNQSINS